MDLSLSTPKVSLNTQVCFVFDDFRGSIIMKLKNIKLERLGEKNYTLWGKKRCIHILALTTVMKYEDRSEISPVLSVTGIPLL